MSTFVYNDGSFDPEKKGVLSVTFGMFFDGTKNNRYHTEIRKKIENKGEFKDQAPTQEERDIYANYGDNESFGNDFTNVARKWYCCERKKYAIYVEGIGTVGKEVKDKDDEMDGFAYGRGVTGIIAKVHSGCKMLAEKIKEEYDKKVEDDDINHIHLIVDAFGFSRGAAAARHFLYNLQKRAYPPSCQSINTVHNIDPSLAVIKTDYAGYFIKDSWVKDGLLPRYGFLGISLLEAGISRELIETMGVKVRFLGIYDTVASYDPNCILIPNFEKQIHKLHLHDLGTPTRAVHYTALDEHRENFSLTRLKIGQEFEFPGVHSDVGGSYNHDKLSTQEFARKQQKAKLLLQSVPTRKASEYEMVRLDSDIFLKNFEKFRQELISEGWFTEDQIKIKYQFPIQKHLYAERILNRGYSFIPLHFMCDEAANYLAENLFGEKILSDYALEDDFLEKVKNYLKQYTIEGKNKWRLIDSSVSHNYNNNISPLDIQEIEPADNTHTTASSKEIIPTINLEQVEISAYRSDYILRKLRNQYLHWSAKLNTFTDRIANSPAKNRKRMDF
ncbi:hypothetical protein CAPN001_24480 [Capnocytophaga stomatis]|uniref:phospholipase effector Tle1 domain-containing protein n=1 Tax=Capnocytophaga stomatis TaxID=1848904 RepID=UPI0019504A80|nr:DUF2235 domain-containing protein [Capnocytophaga stomatis]GIJ97879.1 hypothetical protein CAPN001_24480 [Capnocytophaga stomatis]